MPADISGIGAVLKLGDGEHRVRFPIRNLIAIEQHFGGIEAVVTAFGTHTIETNFVVLSNAVIDGELWEQDKIEAAMEGVGQIDLAMALGEVLMDRMSYSDQTDKPPTTTDPIMPGERQAPPLPAQATDLNGSIGLG